LLKQPNARWRAASAPLFAALGDETRLGLVSTLSTAGPQSIARLTAGTQVTRQAVTKHLRVMEKAGLVSATRHGKEQRWEFVPAGLEEVRRSLDVISQQWDAALGRLKTFVER
jgi:DNA-binding transcriptional ArsR family regulator